MFDIGFLELVVVGIIGLLVLGPERLPGAARTLGKWVGRARRMVSQFTQEIDKEIEIEALKAKLREQGESLNINEDVRKIQETVSQALSEAEDEYTIDHLAHMGDFEPLPRKEADQPFKHPPPSQTNQQTISQTPSQAQSPNNPHALASKTDK